MLTRYCDRRLHIRVPADGPARWQSGARSGHCELCDISPAGLGLRMPIRGANQLEDQISLAIELAPGEHWTLAENARVVRRALSEDGLCHVGVELQTPEPRPPA